MSKLIDSLNKMVKAVPQPIGFKTAPPISPKAKMILIASMTQSSNISAADAILISRLDSEVKTLSEIARSHAAIPWGLFSEDASRRGFESVAKAGCDFVVFPASAPLTMPENDKTGKILQVEASLNEGLIKAINELPVDAVLITREQTGEGTLTWQHLMLFQRFTDLLTKPLLVNVPLNVTTEELQLLWKTGVEGVVVAIEHKRAAGRLKELRQMINTTDFTPRRRGKTEALLPHISSEVSAIPEDEEEDTEEE